MPAKLGAPLLAWDTLTLEQLWKVALPAGDGPGAASKDGKFEGISSVLYEYLDLCIDWDRVVLSAVDDQSGEDYIQLCTTAMFISNKMTRVRILPRQMCRDVQDAGAANYNYNLVTVFSYLLVLRICKAFFWVHTSDF